MIFARKIDDNLTSLVKKIDANKNINSFVCFLNDDEGFDAKIKSFAEKNGIKKCVLALDNPAGPDNYKVAKEAEVTVILYTKRKVEANHAFRAGELNAKGIEAVVKDLSKIEPSK